jgi:hypothetical protein
MNKKNINNYKRRIISTNTRKRPEKAKFEKITNSAFITGGIGDVIAVESFLPDFHRQNLKTIFYATNKRIYIEEIFNCLKSFPNLKEHISVWDDFSSFWCFYSIEDYFKKVKENEKILKVKNALDLSISKVFQSVKNGIFKYNNSSFLKEELIKINKFNLPKDFVIILPYSTDKRVENRDFNNEDWNNIIKTLNKFQINGVVINSKKEFVPNNNYIIDLSEKTNLLEAIEILKISKGYFGIDSWLSVLAAKLFENTNLQIKSNNLNCYNNSFFYYAPKKNFDFMLKKIIIPEKIK